MGSGVNKETERSPSLLWWRGEGSVKEGTLSQRAQQQHQRSKTERMADYNALRSAGVSFFVLSSASGLRKDGKRQRERESSTCPTE